MATPKNILCLMINITLLPILRSLYFIIYLISNMPFFYIFSLLKLKILSGFA